MHALLPVMFILKPRENLYILVSMYTESEEAAWWNSGMLGFCGLHYLISECCFGSRHSRCFDSTATLKSRVRVEVLYCCSIWQHSTSLQS